MLWKLCSCTEVNINNSSGYYTGRSGGAPGGSTAINTVYTDQTSTTKYNTYGFYTYDGYLLDYDTNTKSTTKDMSKVASTTDNIYGVYDMSGGSYEYTMANMVDTDGTTMVPSFSDFRTTTYPDAKYYDKYSYSTSYTSRKRSKLGDGIKEIYNTSIYGWYRDHSGLAYSSSPWFLRGGYYSIGSSAGVFYSHYDDGNSYSFGSSRSVITP